MRWASRIIGAICLLAVLGILLISWFPGLAGLEALEIKTGSMSPEIPPGSIAYIDSSGVENISEGDVIAYEDLDGRVILHRVESIEDNGIITKGDANDEPDPDPVTPNQVIGKMAFGATWAGNDITAGIAKIMLGLLTCLGVSLLAISMSLRDHRKEGFV